MLSARGELRRTRRPAYELQLVRLLDATARCTSSLWASSQLARWQPDPLVGLGQDAALTGAEIVSWEDDRFVSDQDRQIFAG